MRVPVLPVLANGNALVPRGGSCYFSITATGGPGGALGQLPDGQNRIGDDSLSPASYTIDGRGGLTDRNHRGCILTPPTSQLQCDSSATPTPGFSIGYDGTLSLNGSSQFWASPTEANGGYNIYKFPPANQQGTVNVTLTADNCKSGPPSSSSAPLPPASSSIPPPPPSSKASSPPSSQAPPPPSSQAPPPPSSQAPPPPSSQSQPPPSSQAPPPSSQAPPLQSSQGPPPSSSQASPPSSSQASPPPSSQASSPPSSQAPPPPSQSSVSAPPSTGVPSSCPAGLTGTYEYPHLIVPVDAAHPDKVIGTSYFGKVSGNISSIFDFDIPEFDAGKSCSLVFLLPIRSSLDTSDFSLTGTGAIDFLALAAAANSSTTYNNRPAPLQNLGHITVVPGNSYTLGSFACPGGKRVGVEVSAYGDTYLSWFQDFNPPAIGLYITIC
ncbi:MAG: hypothetical protein M1821_005002 [Bathelium mastoideum]|nr:MAG: hypothetical protein M1821_005002 [Bathelium mastoideum]